MSAYSLKHLRDEAILRRLAELAACERQNTALLLAHLAEVEERQLHLRAGYDSMKAYCVGELCFSDDAAAKRISAAHVARRYPALFEAVADGRVHLTGIGPIAASLTTANCEEMIAAGECKTVAQIREYLVSRYPQAEELRFDDGVQVVAAQQPDAIGQVSKPVQSPAPRVAPLSPERYSVQVTIARATYDKLRRAQDLLGHAMSGRDVSEVLDRALDALVEKLEKRKVGVGTRKAQRPAGPGTIPAHVKRAVWERDGGRCSLVGDGGRRCGSTARLEFDHIEPVALGGASTAENVRLLCRVHNQFAADQAFGREFMGRKRNAKLRRRRGRSGGEPVTEVSSAPAP